MGTEADASLKVLMVPWLGYGHIYPFLELAKKLTDRGFCINLCSTPINLDSIKKKITPKYAQSIQLVELHLPVLPELPAHYHTTNGLPPHLMATLRKALYKAKPNLSNILNNLSPDLVIYDINNSYVAALTARHNIPAVKFSTSSAVMLAYFCHMAMRPATEFPFPSIYLSKYEQATAGANLKSARQDIDYQDPEDRLPTRFCDSIALVKTSREFDKKYMDYLSDLFKWKVHGVCPLLHDPADEGEDDDQNELIQWLGEKSERSSIFVSFGSEYFLKKEEIQEIAFGLELSNVNFIWVLRFPKGEATRIEEALPEGFLERVKDRGRIVEGWAPQAKILRHPSTGGFVSHCGWNSVLESIEIGVPIIAMPMHLDQPFNARLVKEIGVAVEVIRDENGGIKREEIAQVIKDVVMGKTGEILRKKVGDVGEKLRAREQGDVDEVVEMLTQLCKTGSGMP